MADSNVKPPARNPALRMLGLPALPRKLPSRNWMIFWTLSAAISGAIIYDKREKKRATAKWAHAVEHLAKEPLSDPLAQPRKLTIYLSSPPGDGLRTAQDHFTEYVKPVLAASGLDWEFVQGRQEGDVRAVVAERVRKVRRSWEKDLGAAKSPDELPTNEEIMAEFRRNKGILDYSGIKGDIVIGRHTWKEYIRGLHEGWLGPLAAPPAEPSTPQTESSSSDASVGEQSETEKKPERPLQPLPYNKPANYPSEILPLLTPAEFSPSVPIRQPHIIGFSNTFIRLRRFFNRRALADDIGREVAAACLASYRDYRDLPTSDSSQGMQCEQQAALCSEEKDWIKKVWKEDESTENKNIAGSESTAPEKIWASPIVLDSRVAMRMRRFDLDPTDEAQILKIVVPEEEIEGWTKGRLRALYRWGSRKLSKEVRSDVGEQDGDGA